MFAVTGWAVSAEALTSAKPHVVSSTSPIADHAPLKSTSRLKKRRRDELGTPSESRVTSEDLQSLWNKEFEHGSGVKRKPSKARKEGKKQIQLGPKLRHEDHAMLEGDGENGSNIHESGILGFENGLKRSTKQKAEKARKKKPRRIPPAQKSAGDLPEKPDTNGGACSAQPTKHDKVKGRQMVLHDNQVPKTIQKLEELPGPTLTTLTPLQAKMRDKLTSARFRHLNEMLYTSPSSASLDLFTASPSLFAEYHAGFAQQVKDSWPENPVVGYIHEIGARAKANFQTDQQDIGAEVLPIPRRKTGSCTIADLGCGDASLARAFLSSSKGLNLRFHNFDFHTPNSLVAKSDIADLPLRDGEADIAVFCLSLMGTNWISFIEEAWRVLRGDGKGELWVAEVKSRFGRIRTGRVVDNSVGMKQKPPKLGAREKRSAILAADDAEVFADDEGTTAQDETDVSAFVDVVQRRGFVLRADSVNKRNKMFVSMSFNKGGIPAAGKYRGQKWNGCEYEKSAGLTSGRKKFIDKNNEDDEYLLPEEETKALKPCVYKKR